MAHFAELDENNIVKKVIVVNNDDINNEPFPQSEPIGIAFCKSLFGQDTNWVQTSYNNSFRRQYAGVGFYYYQPLDVFVEPKPYPSWSFREEYATWQPPIPKPNDSEDSLYLWNEELQQWVLITIP